MITVLLLIISTQALFSMKKDDIWNLDRYFETKELVRWGTTNQEKACQYVKEGEELWTTIIQSKDACNSENQLLCNFDQEKELTKRVSVCWYLYSKALEQQKPFYNGMFVIKDTDDQAVYNFFYHYVKKTIDTTHEKPVYVSTNLFSYARHSTHFKYDKVQGSEYGIDIRYKERNASAYDLPSGCCHILFGLLTKNNDNRSRMYLKMEDAGLYFTELPCHTVGVCASFMRKLLPYLLGTNIASKIITLNNQKFCQKEHFPENVSDLYNNFCKKYNLKKDTIHTIFELWEWILKQDENDNISLIKEFLQKNYTNLTERFGNEIIIDTFSGNN